MVIDTARVDRRSPAGNMTAGESPGVQHAPESRNGRLYFLSLAALGIVFGDIGTSPLYALRECFGTHIVPFTPDNVLGVLSLIFWSLVVVISVKYVAFVMRADNQGEGGILALMTLVGSRWETPGRMRNLGLGLGLFGSALLYGDGMITPAISVLSAVEGLEVATPHLSLFVIPLAVAILCALFLLQRHGTGTIGVLFGPVMVVWFTCLILLGGHSALQTPAVLAALNPLRAVRFAAENGLATLFVLAPVFLVVTGGEALYADMGHFGRRPIRLAWFAIVLPALVINYFGQGALLIRRPDAAGSPFYLLAPAWGLLPLVALATLATVIASQAMISGSFSLARQALHLGYSPRLEVRHSSAEEIGQVYVPLVNWVLLLATVGLVLGFGSSERLAGAYGVAVSMTMLITTVLAGACAHLRWGWSLPATVAVTAVFLVVDTAFFAANLTKVLQGGWFPLLVGLVFCLLMTTWYSGRRLLAQRLAQRLLSVDTFLRDVAEHPPLRAPGTAVFLTSSSTGIPPTLLHNVKHNRVLHERVVLMTVLTETVPRVPPENRIEMEMLGPRMVRIVAHYGYLEMPNVPVALRQARPWGLDYAPMETTFFLARETLVVAGKYAMAPWRKRLFAFMSQNAQLAATHFRIPPNRVVELGTEVEI
jgi:KUP system potassium uptake protein